MANRPQTHIRAVPSSAVEIPNFDGYYIDPSSGKVFKGAAEMRPFVRSDGTIQLRIRQDGRYKTVYINSLLKQINKED